LWSFANAREIQAGTGLQLRAVRGNWTRQYSMFAVLVAGRAANVRLA